MSRPLPQLHIYAQTYSHDHAFIVGNKEALQELRNALNRALESGATSETTAYTTDGEGFEIKVYCEDGDSYWDKATLPYTDCDYLVKRNDDIGPWDLFKKYQK